MNKLLFVSFVFLFLKASGQSSIRHISSEGKNVFQADGYYFSTAPIKIGTFKFKWLSIFTQYAGSSALQIRLTKNGVWKNINAYSFRVSKDNSYFYFKDKSCGIVSVIGKFTGSNGPAADQVLEKNTVVFKGKMLVNGVAHPIEFTWWEGD